MTDLVFAMFFFNPGESGNSGRKGRNIELYYLKTLQTKIFILTTAHH